MLVQHIGLVALGSFAVLNVCLILLNETKKC